MQMFGLVFLNSETLCLTLVCKFQFLLNLVKRQRDQCLILLPAETKV